ncbi:hypothetical protein B0H12DRAFT_451814 [Mycena haematopus]|nr:hypothetical protein B0H12DRAFT_451814 [Mycena haematopus]
MALCSRSHKCLYCSSNHVCHCLAVSASNPMLDSEFNRSLFPSVLRPPHQVQLESVEPMPNPPESARREPYPHPAFRRSSYPNCRH